MSRHRNWCFTINNYSNDDWDALTHEPHLDELGITYIVVGREVGDSGTPHLQGYIEFKTANSLRGIIKKLGKHGHYEPRRGTQKQASDYCKKDGVFFEFGEPKQENGVRKDWKVINTNIQLGMRVRDQIEQGANTLQHIQHIEKISKYLEPKRNFMPRVYWFWGPSGTGKSHTASEMFPDAYWTNSFEWWDGYDGHSAVIIDDYRADFCKFHELLRLLDRYPYQVPIKGGFRQFVAKDIIITTPKNHTETWSSRSEENLYQLKRRIYKEVEFTQASLGNTDTKEAFNLLSFNYVHNYDDECNCG